MSHLDFDRVVDRRGSDSIKWSKYAGRDVIPLWVADMDFAAPPAVLDALHRRVEHGVLGYAAPTPSLVEATLTYLDAGRSSPSGWSGSLVSSAASTLPAASSMAA